NPPDYRMWVAQRARKNLDGQNSRQGTNGLKLVVTVIEGDDQKPPENSPFWVSSVSTVCYEIATNGNVSGSSSTFMGVKGWGGGRPIPAQDLKRLDELLAVLPEDGSRLPPAGRRLMLQAATNTGSVVRVYDRANTPETVWEILRLCRCGVRSWSPE